MIKTITFLIGIMASLTLNSQIDYAIKFKVTAPNGHADETIVRLEQSATQSFDGQWDAWKMFTWNDSVPSIYSSSVDSFAFAINAIPFMVEDSSMFLTMRIPLIGGSYLMETEQLGDFPPGIKIAIRDLENNAIYELCANQSFNFNVNASASDFDRFELFYSTEAFADTTMNSVILTNLGNTNWDYVIKDETLNTVSSATVNSESIQVDDLEIGNYTAFVTDQYGLEDTLYFEVTSTDSTDADPPVNTSSLNENSKELTVYQNMGQNYLRIQGEPFDSDLTLHYYSFTGALIYTESFHSDQVNDKLLYSNGNPLLIVVQSNKFQESFKVLY